jgi:subtilisin-like proprotein convertase family protein
MKYSSLTLSNVCGTSPGRKTAVKCHSNRYASTAKILALLLASNSAFGYTDFGGALGTPLPIPDTDGSTALEHVVAVAAGSCVIADIDVILAYSHTSSGDMDITLTAPDGTGVQLLYNRGGTYDVDAAYPITFNDESPNPITNFIQYWNDPKVTEFQSEGGGYVKLSGLYGKAATGAWKLTMTDIGCGDAGSLHCAILHFTCAGEVPLSPSISCQPSISSQPSSQPSIEEPPEPEDPPEPESPPTLSGKAGKGLKGPSKSGKGVKAPQLSGKGSKVEVYGVSNNQMVEPQAVPLTTIQLPSDVDEAVEDAFANMIVNIKELNVFKGNTDVFQGVRGSESNVVKVVASGEEK